MDYHKNARTTVWSREQMVRQVIECGSTLAAAAAAANVSAKTTAKWVRRYRQLGTAGLVDRSCRPHHLRRPTKPEQVALIEAFLGQALAYYARIGIRFRALLTDNGPAYRSRLFARTCKRFDIKHRFTRPYTPRTNGKAEPFIRTALQEWAYARTYQNSAQRCDRLQTWIHDYNWHRPHASPGQNTPISRAGFDRNNLLTLHK
jgi:transposase-like protein